MISLDLPFTGPDGSTIFTEGSTPPKGIYPFGNAKISTLNPPPGGYSAGVFDGAGDYLRSPQPPTEDFSFGTAPFYMEVWCYITANSAPRPGDSAREALLFGTFPETGIVNSGWIFAIGEAAGGGTGSRFYLDIFNGSAESHAIKSGTTIPHNQWVQLACSREGSALKLFIDGVDIAAPVSNFTAATPVNSVSPLRIGGIAFLSNPYYLNGYLAKALIVKGSSTPPGKGILSGTALKASGGGAEAVYVLNSAIAGAFEAISPDPASGEWEVEVWPGDYFVVYLADGCAPICHGPYTVTAD